MAAFSKQLPDAGLCTRDSDCSKGKYSRQGQGMAHGPGASALVFLVRQCQEKLPGWGVTWLGTCFAQGLGKASDILVEVPTLAGPALLF